MRSRAGFALLALATAMALMPTAVSARVVNDGNGPGGVVSIKPIGVTAAQGQAVRVHAEGLRTSPGAGAFAMVCAIGDQPGMDLRCDPSAPKEQNFDGDFDATVFMPITLIDSNGDHFDCVAEPGCVVVFGVLDEKLDTLHGSGVWVEAISPQP